jgi:predicted XRE-type DNA-binding protein
MPTGKTLDGEPSSGNVFANLGLPNAADHLIKAGLVLRIDGNIRRRHLTQGDAAQRMGIDQPTVSAILAGRFRGYSVERLMRFLVALGHDVEIFVKPVKGGAAERRVARSQNSLSLSFAIRVEQALSTAYQRGASRAPSNNRKIRPHFLT